MGQSEEAPMNSTRRAGLVQIRGVEPQGAALGEGERVMIPIQSVLLDDQLTVLQVKVRGRNWNAALPPTNQLMSGFSVDQVIKS